MKFKNSMAYKNKYQDFNLWNHFKSSMKNVKLYKVPFIEYYWMFINYFSFGIQHNIIKKIINNYFLDFNFENLSHT